jgi:hypothetical protein
MAALLHQTVQMSIWVLLLQCALAFAQDAALTCINNATGFGLLTQQDAFVLCQGTTTSAPYDCYTQATTRALIDSSSALKLCRCTLSTGRVDCYVNAHNSTSLTDAQILDLCTHDIPYATACNPTPPS